ncbi:MAG: DUF4440 domain-containing protein [Acidobacteria bacterium]|nr:DUF4440 domain-containing protein [Acidobacteriota bacterium]
MRWITVATVFLGSMMGAGIVVADDVDDVKAAYLQHIANSNSGNVDGFVGQHLAGHSAFGPTGALLTRYDSIEDEKKLVRAALDAGRAANPGRSSVRAFSDVQVRHLEARIYGRLSAVVTAYLTGRETASDGTSRQRTLRASSMWIKQGGQWKEVHDHMSDLQVGR